MSTTLEPTRRAFPDGFEWGSRVTASRAPFAAHQCVVMRTVDGLVLRIDEYVDPTMLAQLGVV